MIVDTTQAMEALAASDATRIPEELLSSIARAEAEVYASGVFSGLSNAQVDQIRSFYERLVVLLTRTGEFADAESKFTLLRRVYQLPYSRHHPSAYEGKIISLHLLLLYTSKDKSSYYLELASLEPRVAASADVKAIVEFEQLIELGNYQRAFDLVQTLSLSHQALLCRLDEQRRYQKSKMVEYTHPQITLAELWGLLEVKDTDDLGRAIAMIDELYEVS